MLLSATKLARWVHAKLVEAGLAPHTDFGKASMAYRKVVHALSGLAAVESKETTLKRLKQEAANLPYFRMSGNSDDFAQAVWDGRKAYISHLEEEISERQSTETETAGDSTDSSTSDSETTDGSTDSKTE